MAKRFLKTAVVSALFALTLAVSASAASAGGATTTTAVNFRTGAGTNYGIISTLPAGTHVVVSTRSSGGWATVVYNGTVGYISSDYLKRANEMDASFGTGTINGSYVRMRSGASTSSSILGTYNSGTTMTITGVNGAWYKVSYNGTTGYVHSDYVSLSGVTNGGSSTGSSNGSVKGSDVRMRSGPSTNLPERHAPDHHRHGKRLDEGHHRRRERLHPLGLCLRRRGRQQGRLHQGHRRAYALGCEHDQLHPRRV